MSDFIKTMQNHQEGWKKIHLPTIVVDGRQNRSVKPYILPKEVT